MDTTKNDGSMPGFDEYKNSIDGSDVNSVEPVQKEDEPEEEEATDDESLKKELDQNFPLSGGGTEPYFDNEGA